MPLKLQQESAMYPVSHELEFWNDEELENHEKKENCFYLC